jgi:hypothetical protein
MRLRSEADGCELVYRVPLSWQSWRGTEFLPLLSTSHTILVAVILGVDPLRNHSTVCPLYGGGGRLGNVFGYSGV